MNGEHVVFACAVTDAASQAQACLLAESIRRYGGRLAGATIWVCEPQEAKDLSSDAARTFDRWHVRRVTFAIEPGWQGIPFAGKVAASATAEAEAAGRGQLLVWLDPDTIFFQVPDRAVAASGKGIGLPAGGPQAHRLCG